MNTPTGSIDIVFSIDKSPSMAAEIRAFNDSLPQIIAKLQETYAEVRIGLNYFALAFNGTFEGTALTNDFELIKQTSFFANPEPEEGTNTDAANALDLNASSFYDWQADTRKVILLTDSPADPSKPSPLGGTLLESFTRNATDKNLDVTFLNTKDSGTESEYQVLTSAVNGTLLDNVAATDIIDVIFDEIESDIAVNTDPDAVSDTAVVDEDASVTINVLDNDTDLNSDTLTIDSVTDGTNGTAVIEGDTIVYTPNANFNGSDTVTYVISDGNGGTDTASVTITVNAVNDGPDAADDVFSYDASKEGLDIIGDILNNDTDIDGDTLKVFAINGETTNVSTQNGDVIVDLQQGGSITLSESGELQFNDDGDFDDVSIDETLTTSFEYTVTDADGATDTATVDIVVKGTKVVIDDPEFTIVGTDGNNVLHGTIGVDIVDAKAGRDIIYTRSGDDVIYAGDGSDVIISGAGNDLVYGEAGDDRMYGSSGNDTLIGGDGNDRMSGGTGDDVMEGGAGRDVMYAFNGANTMSGGSGTDYMYGGWNRDIIRGDEGDDVVRGRGGNDNLFGGDGNDCVSGGWGNDTMFGESGNDYMTGDSGNDTISGGDGADRIFGGWGNDIIDGGALGDIMYGGRGADIFDYNNLSDSIVNNSDSLRYFEQHDSIDMSDLNISFDDLIIEQNANNLTSVGIKDTEFEIEISARHTIGVDDFIF